MHIVLVVRTAASASKAASAGNSKSVQVQSRRKLRKATESQAKRQRRQKQTKSFRYNTRQAPDSAGRAALQVPICQCKAFLLGFQRGHSLLRKRMTPLSRSPAECRGNTLPAQRECCIYFLRSTNFWYCSEIFFRIFSISRLPSSCVSRTKFFVPSLKNSMNASVTMRRVSRSRFL